MKVLVTGATGFIGRRVVRTLLDAGISVRVGVRAMPPPGAFPLEAVESVTVDLRSDDGWPSAVRGIDGVIHLASLLKTPWATSFEKINVEGTRRIAQACAADSSPPALIVVSSLAAAGPSDQGTIAVETMMPNPVSIYGRTKLLAERAAETFSERLPLTIIRPPMVYGPGDRATAPIFRGIARGIHLMPTWRDFRVSMIHVDDLALGLIAAVTGGKRRPMPGLCARSSDGLYYLADKEIISYQTFGRRIARAMDRSDPSLVRVPGIISYGMATAVEMVARLQGRPASFNRDKWRETVAGDWVCCAEKARRELNWKARFSLADRLRQTVDAYRADGTLGMV